MSSLPQTQRGDPPVVANVANLLAANMKAIQSCLPKHMTPERMCRVALQTIRRTPALMSCTPESLVAAIVEASSLGLELDLRGQAYLVPYGKNVTLIPGYKGLMDLAYRSGRVTNIYAEVVCENDRFAFALGLAPKLEHTPNLDDRGALKAVYAVARVKDADPAFVVLGKTEIDKIRKASRASGSGPWVQWEEEMWKKTAIRRLCKYLPLSPEIQKAIALDEAADASVAQHLADGIIDLPAVAADAPTAGLNAALTEGAKGRRPTNAEMETRRKEAADAWLATGNPLEDAEKLVNAYARNWTTAQCEKVRQLAAEAMRSDARQEQQEGAPATAEQPEAQPAPVANMITCPKTETQVSDWTCSDCEQRAGCPAWAE